MGALPTTEGRVLVVDDEPGLVRTLKKLLEPRWTTEVATSAQEALARLGAGPFDAVLCDLSMRDMSGMELYAEAARRFPGVEKRFVFMTGGIYTSSAAEFLASVPNGRIEKPFELDDLETLIRGAAQPA